MDGEMLRRVVIEAIEGSRQSLNVVSNEIWSHPETALEEHHAHEVLCRFLSEHGFEVEKNFVLDTGFRATITNEQKRNGRNVAVVCEYDALPAIGHACGHNLIAEVGLATAIGVKAVADARDVAMGQLIVLGTPAEEAYGGKIDFVKEKVFDNVDFVVMAHPGPYNITAPTYLARKGSQVLFDPPHISCWTDLSSFIYGEMGDVILGTYGSKV